MRRLPACPACPAGEALEVLERIGTPQARQLLQTLADGAPGVHLTVTAQLSLKRLEHRRCLRGPPLLRRGQQRLRRSCVSARVAGLRPERSATSYRRSDSAGGRNRDPTLRQIPVPKPGQQSRRSRGQLGRPKRLDRKPRSQMHLYLDAHHGASQSWSIVWGAGSAAQIVHSICTETPGCIETPKPAQKRPGCTESWLPCPDGHALPVVMSPK